MSEIFAAVYTKLNADLSVPVYDHVPQDIYTFPYVRIDPLVLNNFDTDLELGFNATIQIVAFSQYKGTKEVSDLGVLIYDSLHRFAMADTASYGVSAITQEFSTIALENDGETRQSIQRFNILFENLP